MYFYVSEAKLWSAFSREYSGQSPLVLCFNQGGNAKTLHALTPNTQSLNVHSQPNEHMMYEIPTPIRWDRLEHKLEGYDKGLKTYFVNGFRYGFSEGCVETPTAPLSKNHNSALKHKRSLETINKHV